MPKTVPELPLAGQGRVAPTRATVLLFAPELNRRHWATLGVEHALYVRVWEVFLRKYRIPFKTVGTLDDLGFVPRVVVLPSLLALGDAERAKLLQWKQQGSGFLSTWLTGTVDANGRWVGTDFMRQLLGVQVHGDTAATEDVNFLMTHGNGSVAALLPAGTRVWLERVAGLYPLLLAGARPEATIMDWSRVNTAASGTVIASAETATSTGFWSRSVVLGYNERLWMSADPKVMEALAYSALGWLLRQSDAQLARWPGAAGHALSFAIDAQEVMDDNDGAFIDWIGSMGGKTSVFITGAAAAKSVDVLKKLRAAGHPTAPMGDRLVGFAGQALDVQRDRLRATLSQFQTLGVVLDSPLSFRPPLESMDDNTAAALQELGFAAYIGFMDRSDGREPVLHTDGPARGLVLLPHTVSGPEALIAEGDPAEGVAKFAQEFTLALEMGGLVLVKFPNQSLLVAEDLDALKLVFEQSGRVGWRASPHEVADWWRSRAQIGLTYRNQANGMTLEVRAPAAARYLPYTPYAVVQRPWPHAEVKWAGAHRSSSAHIVALDPWRVAVPLLDLQEGVSRYEIQFDSN